MDLRTFQRNVCVLLLLLLLQGLAPMLICEHVQNAQWGGTAEAGKWVSPTASHVRSCPPPTPAGLLVVSPQQCLVSTWHAVSQAGRGWPLASRPPFFLMKKV